MTPSILKPFKSLVRVLIIFALTPAILSCGSQTDRREENQQMDTPLLISETQQAFFDNLASFCGQTFSGEQIYRSHHSSGWAGIEMTMHVEVCEDQKILVPFHVGEDQSRTWMFLVEDGRLRFRHDHRYPDGTPEDETLYGGYANESGTAFVQHFPADEYTAHLIEGGEGNIWTVRISEDMTTFTYRLERDGEKRLRVDFDLSRPL